MAEVGPERVLAGSDCPFNMNDHRPFEAPGSLGLDDHDRARVLGGNATALFGLGGGGPGEQSGQS